MEKPLVKKAKSALQALKKRKQHIPGATAGPSSSGGASSGAQRPATVQQQQQPSQQGSSATAALHAAVSGGLPTAASDDGVLSTYTSRSTSDSLSRSPSSQPGTLAVSASGSWAEHVGGGTLEQVAEGSPLGSSGADPLSATQQPQPAASTPPKAVLLASYPSGKGLPVGPPARVQWVARSTAVPVDTCGWLICMAQGSLNPCRLQAAIYSALPMPHPWL